MLPAVVAGIGANVVGGIVGNLASQSDRNEAQAALNNAMKEIQDTGAPPDLSRQIVLKHFESAGLLTPEIENNINQQFSSVADIKEDPSLRENQIQALQILRQRSQTGMGPEDRAALNQIRGEMARDEEAKRQQILENYRARGLGGGGAELAASLASSQGAANRASEQGDTIGAQASQRALEYLRETGNLSSGLRSQDFNIANTKGEASDALQRFNIQNQLGVQSRNVNNKNQAGQFNLQNQQQISNANVSMDNAEKMRELDAQRQNWLDKLTKAQALAGNYKDQANAANSRAQQTAAMWSGIGSGISSGIGANEKNQNDLAIAKLKYGG